jgi:regulator of replication initiation timing
MDAEEFYLQRIAQMAASAAKVACDYEQRYQQLMAENTALRTENEELQRTTAELALSQMMVPAAAEQALPES